MHMPWWPDFFIIFFGIIFVSLLLLILSSDISSIIGGFSSGPISEFTREELCINGPKNCD